MLNLLKSFLRQQRISFFYGKVSVALRDLGVDRRKLPFEPLNSFCEDAFEKVGAREAAALFFSEHLHQFPADSYMLRIGGYDLIFRASKIIGIWRDKATLPAISAQKIINKLEDVCRLIEYENPEFFKKPASSPQHAHSSNVDEVEKFENYAWNIMVHATKPDRCWKIASEFRPTNIPGSVLTCEMAFLTASIVRGAVRATFPTHAQEKAITSSEAAYFKTFDDEAKNPLPDEMKTIYGSIQLNQLARSVLSQYGRMGDNLQLTVPLFIHRIHGDPRMLFEIMPSIETSRDQVVEALRIWLK